MPLYEPLGTKLNQSASLKPVVIMTAMCVGITPLGLLRNRMLS